MNLNNMNSLTAHNLRADKKANVLVGYLDKVDNLKFFHSRCFPSKVGGKPAWLNPESLPPPEAFLCESCQLPMTFVMQIFASKPAEHCFLRSIYVFTCTRCKDRFKAWRCQLPRENQFYSSTPPDYENPDVTEFETATPCCNICGIPPDPNHECTPTLAEYELNVETFLLGVSLQSLELEDALYGEHSVSLAHANQMAANYLESIPVDPEAEDDVNFEKEIQSLNIDPAFQRFMQVSDYAPGHVIRYDIGGKPLWFSSEDQISVSEVPPCPSCNSPREFEFQIQPHIIHKLNAHERLDFGILAIYTCSTDCQGSNIYSQEFVFCQPDK
eukprot:Platyproteum_vivax@DN2458_c0_g1_i1.p1